MTEPKQDALADYFGIIGAIKRAEFELCQVIEHELNKRGFILSAAQALILYSLPPDGIQSVDLQRGGRWVSTNLSHNIGKLEARGYLKRVRKPLDRRGVLLLPTPNGKKLQDDMRAIFKAHATIFALGEMRPADLATWSRITTAATRFWSEQIRFNLTAQLKTH
jgi:DNA-binding MarR family transcriptional regulator